MSNKNGLIVDDQGTKSWYKDDNLHRVDGPAVEFANGGSKWWYQNGKLHREDGPAVEFVDGRVDYWINGEFIRQEKNR
jgi:hypothetical protein